MFFKNLSKIKYINTLFYIFVSLFVLAFFVFVIDSLQLVSETNRNNFAYIIKIRDTIEEIDKIVERAELNTSMLADTIVYSYDVNKLNDEEYNSSYLNEVNFLIKSVLMNSPGVDGAWFQLNTNLPFSNRLYSWCGVKDGRIVNLSNSDVIKNRITNPKDDPYYFEAVKARKLIWTDIYKDPDTNIIMMTIAEPLYKQGKLIGVVGIDISTANLKQTLINMQALFKGSEIFLLDENKNIIIEQLDERKGVLIGHDAFLNLFKKPKSQEAMVEYYDAGTKKTALMLGLSNKYSIVITFPNKLIFQGFERLFNTIYFMIVIMIILIVLRFLNKYKIEKIYNELQKEIDAIKNIVDYAPTVMCKKSRDGVYLHCNDKFAKLVGLKKADVIGKTDYDLFDKKMADMIKNIDRDVIQKKECAINVDWRIVKNGKKKVMEAHILPLLDENNEVIEIFVNAIDITKRCQEQENLEKAVMMKSNFLANMSHEIRTPMNGVVGFLQLLEDTNPTEEQAEMILDAQKSSEILLHIINEILDFSKIEADKLIIDESSFDIRSVVEDVTIMNTPTACNKGLDVNSLICSDVPLRVVGDSARVKQVLNNLVSNAIKFTQDGEVVVYVHQESEDDEKIVLNFSVKDTGIGIDEDKLKFIFDSFTQADASTTRKYGGTGLGLAISQKLAELMGGQIRVESNPNEGSTFTLILPFKKDNTLNFQAGTTIKCLNGTKILIVDNNPTNLKIVKYYLNEANCIIKEAHSQQEAIDIITQENYNFSAVLISYNLQNEAEIELSSRIKSNEKAVNLPLILYAPFLKRKDAVWAKEKGFVACLTKPLKKQELISSIAIASRMKNANISETFITANISNEKKISTNLKILMVEDTELNCKFILKLLNKVGLSCDIANDGIKAIEMFKSKKYDLIFMDCQMPLMDGYEATRQIRKIEGDSFHTPIIAMTANAMKADQKKCYEAGMDDYISKPVDTRKLVSLLHKYVEEVSDEHEGAVVDLSSTDSYLSHIIEEMASEVGFSQSEAIELFDEFLEFLAQSLIKFEAEITENEFDKLKKLAHKLKGASANLKIEKVQQLCVQLENASENADKESCINVVNKIKEHFEYLTTLNTLIESK